MPYPPHLFAGQGNFLVKPPAGLVTPGSWLDDNFAATAPALITGNYTVGSTLWTNLFSIVLGAQGALALDGSNVVPGSPRAALLTTLGAVTGISPQTYGGVVQTAYNFLSTSGGTLYYPTGSYSQSLDQTNRDVSVSGAGREASIISPATATGVAFIADHPVGSWDAVTYADFTIQGAGTVQGTGFRAGPLTYSTNAEYNGGNIFRNVKFSNLDKCIERPFGDIYLVVDNCQFEAANYHHWASDNQSGSGDAMHAGCAFTTNSHFEGALLASSYITSKTGGTAQLIWRDNIKESNPGYVYYRNIVSNATVPGEVIENEYNENNYTAGSVTIGTDTAAPVWGKWISTNSVVVRNTSIGPVILASDSTLQTGNKTAGSNLTTYDCPLDFYSAQTIDADSTLLHYQARLFSGQAVGLVQSIGAVQNQTELNAPVFPMPKPRTPRAFDSSVLFIADGQSTIAFVGTASRSTTTDTTDSGLPWFTSCQSFTINAAESEGPTTSFTVPATTYLVLQYIAKLVSGPAVAVNIGNAVGVGGPISINNAEWRMYTGIFKSKTSGVDTLFHTGGASTSVFKIGGYAIRTFATAQEALVYANSGQFPTVAVASVTYDPPSLADGAGVTTTITVPGAALGQFAVCSFSLDTQGITVTAWVSAANTVSVRFQNESGGTLDLASGTLRAKVLAYTD